jgi:hypothetical protein
MFQIYIFRKGLILFEFQTLFGLNFYFKFKFKSVVKKLQNYFFLSLRSLSPFSPLALAALSGL